MKMKKKKLMRICARGERESEEEESSFSMTNTRMKNVSHRNAVIYLMNRRKNGMNLDV